MCEENKWDMVRASRRGPSFSHVFFADDIMLFAKANTKNCNAIMEVINNFCNLVGQKVNYGKSRVFFSPNVTARRKRTMCRRLGILATYNLGRYLGFPVIHKGRVGNLLMEPLLTDCRNLLKEFPNKRVIHAYYEANQCADALAKLECSPSIILLFFVTHRLWWRLFMLLIRLMHCNRLVNF